jgi:hypothetical protein
VTLVVDALACPREGPCRATPTRPTSASCRFADDSVDLVVGAIALVHLADIEGLLREFARVLRARAGTSWSPTSAA